MTLPVSLVIPTLNAASCVAAAIGAHREAVAEVIVADGGSTDSTADLARESGATVMAAPRGRGPQLAAGAAAATSGWLLFLHADTRLGEGWAEEAAGFIAAPENAMRGAAFRFALDDPAPAARRLERLVAWRSRALALPYGDQGLLMPRALYDAVGGFRPLALYEDVDMVRRIGRARLVLLQARAVTSAARYRRDGYVARPLRNLCCLALYFAGVHPARIAWFYGA